MADVTSKVKMYVFLSIIVLLLNISVAIVKGFENMDKEIIFLPSGLPDGYNTMTVEERRKFINSQHGGLNEWSWSIDPIEFNDGFKISSHDYDDFIYGRATNENSNKLNINYSSSTDTQFVTDVAGSSLTAFLPFTSVVVSVVFFADAFPINLIVGIIIGLISALQVYLLIAIVLNHLPFFNV
jgi:hypothetical protein